MSRPEIVDDVIAAAAAVPQALDRLSEEARAAWAGQLAADVAAERRAAGITVAPEAALHRALQARTDELERVRAELTAEKAFSALVHRRLVEARAARDTAKAAYDETAAACSELRQAVATIEAAYDRAVSERDAAHEQVATMQAGYEAALCQAVSERDEARAEAATDGPAYNAGRSEGHADIAAELRAILDPDDVQHWNITGVIGHVRGLAQSLAIACDLGSVTSADIAHEKVRRAIAPIPLIPTAPLDSVRYARELAADLDTARAERDAAVRERDEARASITRFAEAAAAHDANADVFVDDEYHISTRALVEEFCREHGHPLAHEWATAKITAPDGGAPTAPDVALPCAPAAGAADPLRLSGTSRPPATWWPASDIRGPRP